MGKRAVKTLILSVVLWVFMGPEHRSFAMPCGDTFDIRTLWQAYYVDNLCHYPTCGPLEGWSHFRAISGPNLGPWATWICLPEGAVSPANPAEQGALRAN